MAKNSYTELASKIEDLVVRLRQDKDTDSFLGDFLHLYGIPRNTVQKRRLNREHPFTADDPLVLKKRGVFGFAEDAAEGLEKLRRDYGSKIKSEELRFLIAFDSEQLRAVDTRWGHQLEKPLAELSEAYRFFSPWMGEDWYNLTAEDPADKDAAKAMGDLYTAILEDNPEMADEPHALHVFMVRLLFCFYAEDAGLFSGTNLFTRLLHDNTLHQEENADEYLAEAFASLDVEDKSAVSDYLRELPYVNGKLFSKRFPVPKISRSVLGKIIELGNRDWKDINLDIFGSMFQSVSDPALRGNLGQHYTSISNIMRVIGPLFLDQLKEEFGRQQNSIDGLLKLRERIGKIQVFDPACGSGNFLITAYIRLRELEMDILERLSVLDRAKKAENFKEQKSLRRFKGSKSDSVLFSDIELSNFRGIEIDDFPCEISTLSLWLTEHQMNQRFKKRLGVESRALPLREGGKIVCANALRVSWEDICPHTDENNQEREIYVLGNPPYLGSNDQSEDQKSDIKHVFSGIKNISTLDYVTCWFLRAARYVTNFPKSRFAFVATNSICQGQAVDYLWTHLLKFPIEINFAVHSFKWSNNASGNAGVTCVIVGMRNPTAKEGKYLFDENVRRVAGNINPYLLDAPDVIVRKVKRRSISGLPVMTKGNQPTGKNLIFTREEKNKLVQRYPVLTPFFRRYCGAAESIQEIERYCFWSPQRPPREILAIPEVEEFLAAVQKQREESPKESTRSIASSPWRFDEIRHQEKQAILVPCVSSENREYIPFEYKSKEVIISNLAQAIYDPPNWVFGLISSRMHMVWVGFTCGRLEQRFRYSVDLCYNTFPVPDLPEANKKQIEHLGMKIIEVRGRYPAKSLAELYDRSAMPEDLRRAHAMLDLYVDRCYRAEDFTDDRQRLEVLLKLYQKLTAAPTAAGPKKAVSAKRVPRRKNA